jgi:hypothetical protein
VSYTEKLKKMMSRNHKLKKINNEILSFFFSIYFEISASRNGYKNQTYPVCDVALWTDLLTSEEYFGHRSIPVCDVHIRDILFGRTAV